MDREGQQWDDLYTEAECLWGLAPDWELKTFVSAIPKGRALDLGIGEGRNALYLAHNGFEVEGIDISEEAVQRCSALAAKHGLPVRAQAANLKESGVTEGAYTCIVCSYVLPFLKRSEAEALIGQMKVGLAEGGVVFVAAFTTDDPMYQRCLEVGLEEVEKNTFFSSKRRSHLLFFGKGELKELFTDLEILSHVEGYSLDLAHGEPHHHGWASVLARRSRR
jgi:2-polyprenyl-3-methyl-5-hydroxy-6-metoxy-1,4-benzoquinol methylase